MLPDTQPAARPGVPMTSFQELTRRVREIVAATLQRPLEEVPVDAALGVELGIDSFALVELNLALEENFQVALPDFISPAEAPLRTVLDLALLVAQQTSKP
jgi:acyl carrier protein